jgi:predicted phosphodiesterase
MPKRIDPKKQRRDWRWWANVGLNGLVALSMVLGTVFVFTGIGTPRAAPPTLEVPTAAPNFAPTPLPTVAPTTAPPTPTPKASLDYSFAVAGDSRDGDAIFAKILKQVASEPIAFLIHTGDLVPSGSIENWENFRTLIKDFPLPFYPVPGNHEIVQGKIRNYLEYSGATNVHYSFDKGAVHFSFVDSSVGSLMESEFDWLDNDLAASHAPVKMVIVHHPPFDPAGSTHIMAGDRNRFMRIVKERGTKYVFAGHIHCYEQAERDGVQYFITGGGGAPLYCPPDAGGFYHYIRVHVQGETITTEVVKIN